MNKSIKENLENLDETWALTTEQFNHIEESFIRVHDEAIEDAAKKSYFPEASGGVAGAIRSLIIEVPEE